MSTMGTTTAGTSGTSSTAEAAKGAASEVAGEATSAAAGVKDTVTTEVGSVVGDAKAQAASLLRTSKDELRTQAETRARDLSSALDGAARQLHSMAEGAEDPSSTVAQLSRSAAEQLQRQSRRLEDGGLEGLVADARRFARNRPGAFMLGTIAAGFAVGRLAKHADVKQVADMAKQELTGGGDQGEGTSWSRSDSQQTPGRQAPGQSSLPGAFGAAGTPDPLLVEGGSAGGSSSGGSR